MDNWFSSIRLFEFLKVNGTLACGTLRANWVRKLPVDFCNNTPEKGEIDFRRKGDILVAKYNDRKLVHFVSTIHTTRMVNTGKVDKHGNVMFRPEFVHEYNKHMGGVDRNDKLIGFYSSIRKSLKWYKKIAFHFLEECVLNAFLLYKKGGGNLTLIKFRISVILPRLLQDRELMHKCSPKPLQTTTSWVVIFHKLYHPLPENKSLRKNVYCASREV